MKNYKEYIKESVDYSSLKEQIAADYSAYGSQTELDNNKITFFKNNKHNVTEILKRLKYQK